MPAQQALMQQPESVVRFVHQLIDEQLEWDGAERRSEPRQMISLPVRIQPLDECYNPVGDDFVAVTKNLSGGGVGILHDFPIDAANVLVTLNSRAVGTMNIVANVRHCSYENDKYLIGGRFVVRWKR